MDVLSCDGIAGQIISRLRQKHQLLDDGASSDLRTTCGLVLDGTKINFVVPGAKQKRGLSAPYAFVFEMIYSS